jgi:hypothetical protein
MMDPTHKTDTLDTPLPEITDTVSSNECTGLFPTPPQDPESLESLESLYSMEIPKE